MQHNIHMAISCDAVLSRDKKKRKGRVPSTVDSVWLVAACGAIARAARALLARPFEDDHDHMLELNLVCVTATELPLAHALSLECILEQHTSSPSPSSISNTC